MDLEGYVGVYRIEGGMEELPRRLRSRLARTRFELARTAGHPSS